MPCKFAEEVKRLAAEKSISHTDLADRAKMSYNELNGRLNKDVVIKPAEAHRLIVALDSQTLAGWHIRDTQYTVARNPQYSATKLSLVDVVSAVVDESVDVWKVVYKNKGVAELTESQEAKFRKELIELEIAVANLRKFFDDYNLAE